MVSDSIFGGLGWCRTGLATAAVVLTVMATSAVRAADEAGDPVAEEGVAEAVDTPPAAAAVDEAAEAAPTGPEVGVRVQSVGYSESIQFDEAGNQQHRHRNLNLQLRIRVGDHEDLVSYAGLEVASVLTSSGERLTLPGQHHWQRRHPIMQHAHRAGGRQEFHAGVQLGVPTVAADEIAELRGVVKLVVAKGEVKQAVLRPISLYDNRPVRVVGLDGVSVKVQRMAGQGMVRVEFPMGGPPLERVTLLDADGHAISTAQPRGSGTSNDRAHQDYAAALPDDGGVLLRWRSGIEELEVPFVVTDVPLPGLRGNDMELSVIARPLEELDPLAGLELLEVEIADEE